MDRVNIASTCEDHAGAARLLGNQNRLRKGWREAMRMASAHRVPQITLVLAGLQHPSVQRLERKRRHGDAGSGATEVCCGGTDGAVVSVGQNHVALPDQEARQPYDVIQQEVEVILWDEPQYSIQPVA